MGSIKQPTHQEMYDLLLEQFETFASQFPGIFDPYCRRKTEGHEDSVTVEYLLPRCLRIVEIESLLCSSDFVIRLYYHRPTSAVEFGQRSSFYSMPKSPLMFKADVRTNINGYCEKIKVTLYSSIEQMRHDVITDYESISTSGGVFSGRDFRDVQLDFL